MVIARADFFAGLKPKTQPFQVVPSRDCQLLMIGRQDECLWN